MFAHLGTHVDAPNHFIRGGDGIERVPLERLAGSALVMDFTHKAPDGRIDVADVRRHEADAAAGDILVFRTDWTDRAWGTSEFFTHSPFVTPEVGDWMVEKDIKAAVFDFCEEYAVRSNGFTGEECPYHRAVLAAGIYNIEYVTNLSAISTSRATIMAMPINLVGSDGAPARVIALQNDGWVSRPAVPFEEAFDDVVQPF
jgi:arylformamidase